MSAAGSRDSSQAPTSLDLKLAKFNSSVNVRMVSRSESLRINPSSSPRGTVKHASSGKKKTARSATGTTSPKMKKTTVSNPPHGQSRFKISGVSNKQPNYIHVHHYKQTNLYGAWFNDPSSPGKKKRLFFGSHLTAYLAARAQDRAALKYKPSALDPSAIKLNFREEDYAEDKELRQILTNNEFGELLRRESRPKYTKMEPTRCLRKFLEEEAAEGNIPTQTPCEYNLGVLSLDQYLQNVVQRRNMEPGVHPAAADSDSVSSDDGSEFEESGDEVEVHPVVCKEARNASAVKRMQREMARIALDSSASPVIHTESTRRFPLRSGSKPPSPTPARLNDHEEPPVLEWGAKRSRSNFTRPCLAPWCSATRLLLAPRTEKSTEVPMRAKIHFKLHRMKTKSKTRDQARPPTTIVTAPTPACGSIDLPPSSLDTTNLDLLASTAVAQLLLESPRASAFHRYAKS